MTNKPINIIGLAGWGQDSSHWQNFADLVKNDNINLKIINLPAFGGVKNLFAGADVPDYAFWLEQNHKQELQNCDVLLGHSFGGRVASYFLSQYGKNYLNLKTLILYGVPLFDFNKQSSTKGFISKNIIQKLPKSLRQKFYSIDLKQSISWDLEETFRKVVRFDQGQFLSLIPQEVVFLWGENDTSAPIINLTTAQGLVTNSRSFVLPNQGHNIHLDNPTLLYGVFKKIFS
jgi:pimeloyl-ACP methyl ester carboxylesterase